MGTIYKLRSKDSGSIFYGIKQGSLTIVFMTDSQSRYTPDEIHECFDILEASVANIGQVLSGVFKGA